jgi:DNA-binding beta-propeller fold protein YncE
MWRTSVGIVNRCVLLIGLVASPATLVSAGADATGPFELVADVPLPGDTSRFDYASLDPGRHLLFIAHLGASEILAFDTRKRTVVARIKNASHVHGVLAIPELDRVYASATGSNEIIAIDETSFAIVARMPGGIYPDGMAYAPDAGKLYVSNETGATETVIDVRSNRRVATLQLGGEAGNTQYDSASRHIFVNVQTRRQLVEIDPATDTIVARIDLPGADGNHGLLIDAPRQLAFIACEGNDKLLVIDLKTRRLRDTQTVGSGPDVLAEDVAASEVIVAAESGVVEVFGIGRDDVLEKIGQFMAPNAHIVAVDPDQHVIYLPLKNLSGKPVLRIMRRRR